MMSLEEKGVVAYDRTEKMYCRSSQIDDVIPKCYVWTSMKQTKNQTKHVCVKYSDACIGLKSHRFI